MKKKFLVGMLALPLAFAVNVNADTSASEYVKYDLDTNTHKIKYVLEGEKQVSSSVRATATGEYSGSAFFTILPYGKSENEYTLEDLGIKITSSGCGVINDETKEKNITKSDVNTYKAAIEGPYHINNVVKFTDTDEWITDLSASALLFLSKNQYNKVAIVNTTQDSSYNTTCHVGFQTVDTSSFKVPEYGQKYKIYAFGKSSADASVKPHLASFPLFPTSAYDIATIKTKFGKITDSSLIRKFANNEAGAYEALLAYAQNDTSGREYTYSNKDYADGASLADVSFEEGAFYYVYSNYYDDNGFIRTDLEDVAITKSSSDMLITEVDYGEYKNQETTSVTTTKNPKTGVEDLVYLVPVVLFGGLGVATLTRKKTSFR